MQNQYFDLRIISDLLNTGVTAWQKVVLLRSFERELSLPLVQSCVSPEDLMKAVLSYTIPLLSVANSLSLRRDAMVYAFPKLGNEARACERVIFISNPKMSLSILV
jgi:hypothetical protein